MALPNPLQQLNIRLLSSLRPQKICMRMKNTSLLHKMMMMRMLVVGDDMTSAQ
jgi:hypothetical protein